jgi:hypothetical protein
MTVAMDSASSSAATTATTGAKATSGSKAATAAALTASAHGRARRAGPPRLRNRYNEVT